MKKLSTRTMTSAFALGALLVVGAASGCADDDTGSKESAVKCQGINECKGTSECAGPDGSNDCQGMNTCEGMGWVTVATEQECVDKGGKVL